MIRVHVRDLTDYEEVIQRACDVADRSRKLVASARDTVARCEETLLTRAATRDAARRRMASARRKEMALTASVMNNRWSTCNSVKMPRLSSAVFSPVTPISKRSTSSPSLREKLKRWRRIATAVPEMPCCS